MDSARRNNTFWGYGFPLLRTLYYFGEIPRRRVWGGMRARLLFFNIFSRNFLLKLVSIPMIKKSQVRSQGLLFMILIQVPEHSLFC